MVLSFKAVVLRTFGVMMLSGSGRRQWPTKISDPVMKAEVFPLIDDIKSLTVGVSVV